MLNENTGVPRYVEFVGIRNAGPTEHSVILVNISILRTIYLGLAKIWKGINESIDYFNTQDAQDECAERENNVLCERRVGSILFYMHLFKAMMIRLDLAFLLKIS